MATTTPNYGWDVPTSTDYVKDGATAIETLGDDIDATLWTALGGAYPGLRLIKKQTIGSAVSSVIVTSAFSATYANYLIVVSDTTGSAANDSYSVQMRVGSTTAASNYYGVLGYWGYTGTPGAAGNNNIASWGNVGRGLGASEKVNFAFNLGSPFLASKTTIATQGNIGSDLTGNYTGYHSSATSYDQIVITTNAGTMTGGTIYVYGYKAA